MPLPQPSAPVSAKPASASSFAMFASSAGHSPTNLDVPGPTNPDAPDPFLLEAGARQACNGSHENDAQDVLGSGSGGDQRSGAGRRELSHQPVHRPVEPGLAPGADRRQGGARPQRPDQRGNA